MHAAARRPSVSQQPRKIRSSRNHPYALRAPSGSVSSVASNASSHHSSTSSHHGNNTGTSSVFYSVSGSNPSYSDLSAAAVLAGPASRGDDLNNGSSHDATAWNTGNCIHSRSSSFSSVSSEFSSSSQTSSSGWSDVVDPNDTSAATPNTSAAGGRAYNTPYNGTIGDGAIHYVHTATTYYGSPAMQVSDLGLGHPLTTQQRSVSTGNVGTTSLACLDGALDANLTDLIPHYHQQQTQPGRVCPSAGSMFPVLLQPVPGASISSQSLSPMDRMNGRNGTNAHGSFNMPMGFDQAGMPASSFTDASLGSLADAIRKTAGSSTTTEKAKINFVHGW